MRALKEQHAEELASMKQAEEEYRQEQDKIIQQIKASYAATLADLEAKATDKRDHHAKTEVQLRPTHCSLMLLMLMNLQESLRSEYEARITKLQTEHATSMERLQRDHEQALKRVEAKVHAEAENARVEAEASNVKFVLSCI